MDYMENISVQNRNRLNDQYVKYLFASEENKHFTVSLTNSILECKKLQLIKDFSFVGTELNASSKDDKYCRLDIHGRTFEGNNINIEIQDREYKGMVERILYYFLKSVILQRGHLYKELKRNISITILNFYLFSDKLVQSFNNCYMLINIEEFNDKLTDFIEAHFIEIPKWENKRPKLENMNMLDKWLAYLSNKTDSQERYNLLTGDEIMTQLALAEEKFFSDPEKVLAYVKAEKSENDAIAREDFVRDEEREKRDREIVRQMKKEKIDNSVIKRVTGLSDEVIKAYSV